MGRLLCKSLLVWIIEGWDVIYDPRVIECSQQTVIPTRWVRRWTPTVVNPWTPILIRSVPSSRRVSINVVWGKGLGVVLFFRFWTDL